LELSGEQLVVMRAKVRLSGQVLELNGTAPLFAEEIKGVELLQCDLMHASYTGL
jgi:hypothetical protein